MDAAGNMRKSYGSRDLRKTGETKILFEYQGNLKDLHPTRLAEKPFIYHGNGIRRIHHAFLLEFAETDNDIVSSTTRFHHVTSAVRHAKNSGLLQDVPLKA